MLTQHDGHPPGCVSRRGKLPIIAASRPKAYHKRIGGSHERRDVEHAHVLPLPILLIRVWHPRADATSLPTERNKALLRLPPPQIVRIYWGGASSSTLATSTALLAAVCAAIPGAYTTANMRAATAASD